MDDQAETGRLGRSITTTEDGTVIIVDPELGVAVSGRTLAEAEAEVARRKASAGKAAA
jgi:hypothetical protein